MLPTDTEKSETPVAAPKEAPRGKESSMGLALPVAILALAGLTWWKVRGKGKMTPARRVIYETALKGKTPPDSLRKLADTFEQEGLKAEAAMLRKRADNQELPEPVKAARRQAFQKGMACTDPAAIECLAKVFEQQANPGAAAALRNYAKGLTAAQKAA